MHDFLLSLIQRKLGCGKRTSLNIFETEDLLLLRCRNNPGNNLLYLRDKPYENESIGNIEQRMHRGNAVQQGHLDGIRVRSVREVGSIRIRQTCRGNDESDEVQE